MEGCGVGSFGGEFGAVAFAVSSSGRRMESRVRS